MEKNLSKAFREVMDETKTMFLATAVKSSTFTENENDITENVKALRMVNRMLDLCCDMFEKQEALMDKMDKVMDKYLDE